MALNETTAWQMVEGRVVMLDLDSEHYYRLDAVGSRMFERRYPAALAAARRATRDESRNWSNWLVLSRIEAEAGHAKASVAAYRRARSLNPRSSLFQQCSVAPISNPS